MIENKNTATQVQMIIDTDPGIDDTMAILFAMAHPKIDLIGLTTIHGNVPIETATTNALKICELADIDIPVCQGSKGSLAGVPETYPAYIHGKNGLGDVDVPEPTKEVDSRNAVEFIAEMVSKNPGEITIVPVGPLTNIANFVTLYTDLVPKVKEVILMGGNAFVPGNLSPAAEANIFCDPMAADIVFEANWPVTMVGLDVTGVTLVEEKDFQKIATSKKPWATTLEKIAHFYIEFYRSRGTDGCCMHDVCAVALPIAQELFSIQEGRIRVPTQDFVKGLTVVMPENFTTSEQAWNDRPLQKYANKIDGQAVRKLFVDTLCS